MILCCVWFDIIGYVCASKGVLLYRGVSYKTTQTATGRDSLHALPGEWGLVGGLILWQAKCMSACMSASIPSIAIEKKVYKKNGLMF